MNYEKIIREFLLEHIVFSVKRLEPTTQLIDTGLIDSISIVKVILFLEQKFSIRFTEDDMHPEHFETLQAIVQLVKKKVAEQSRK